MLRNWDSTTSSPAAKALYLGQGVRSLGGGLSVTAVTIRGVINRSTAIFYLLFYRRSLPQFSLPSSYAGDGYQQKRRHQQYLGREIVNNDLTL